MNFGVRTFLIAAWLSWCATCPLQAEGPKTVRLLTVGNSFSQNAMHYLGDVAKAAGNRLILRESDIPGSSMEQHWAKVQAHEKNPNDPAGKYATGRSLQEDLSSDRWDYVTIQQYSFKSHDLSTYQPFATQLRDYIKKYAPTAEVLLHETWEYRSDDPRFSGKSPKPGEPATQAEMYEKLNAAYATVAKELGVRRIPVGDAFHLADHDSQWAYHPDPGFNSKTAQPPTLPDQTHSLHKGWQWTKKDGHETLTMDGHHAGVAGEYLGACVFFEVLFKTSVLENTFLPPGLDPAFARYLRETAHRAVQSISAAR